MAKEGKQALTTFCNDSDALGAAFCWIGARVERLAARRRLEELSTPDFDRDCHHVGSGMTEAAFI
jgi:hypothetical protein